MPFPFPFTLFGANRSSNSGGDACFTYCYGGDWVQGKVGNYGLTLTGSGDTTQDEGYVAINNADGDIVDLNEHLWVKNAKEFIEDGEKNIYVANS